MTKDDVFDSIVAAQLGPEDLVFVGRSGEVYYWGAVSPGQPITLGDDGVYPEAWSLATPPGRSGPTSRPSAASSRTWWRRWRAAWPTAAAKGSATGWLRYGMAHPGEGRPFPQPRRCTANWYGRVG